MAPPRARTRTRGWVNAPRGGSVQSPRARARRGPQMNTPARSRRPHASEPSGAVVRLPCDAPRAADPAIRRRAPPGGPPLRPLGRAPRARAPGGVPAPARRAARPRRAGRDRLVPRPQLARPHVRAGHVHDVRPASSCSATSASSPPARTARSPTSCSRTPTSPTRPPPTTLTGRSTSATRSSAAGAARAATWPR